jgi:DNA-binding FrmR family transcriptional regulator
MTVTRKPRTKPATKRDGRVAEGAALLAAPLDVRAPETAPDDAVNTDTTTGILEEVAALTRGDSLMELDPDQMQSVIKRLNRAQGQIGGIVRMIEDGRDCKDIVTQLAAVSKALDRAGFAVIALGLRQCILDPEANDSMDVESMEKLFLSLA